MVLPIMVHVGPEERGHIYDTWINAYQIEGENIYLADLAQQDWLRIHLYGDEGQWIRTLTVPNNLQEFAQVLLQRRAFYQPSTGAAFDYAREQVYAHASDVRALWQALGPR